MPQNEFGLIGVRRGRGDSLVERDDLEELVAALSSYRIEGEYRGFKVLHYRRSGSVTIAEGRDVDEVRRMVRLKTGIR